MNKENIFNKVKNATVAIALLDENKMPDAPFNIIGSGVCIDSMGVILTCTHVIEAFMSKSIDQQTREMQTEEHNIGENIKTTGPKSKFKLLTPYIIFFDIGDPYNLKVAPCQMSQLVAKTNIDLAMIKIQKHTYYPSGYPFLDIENYNNIHEGDNIGVCGFPLGTVLHKAFGTITSSFSKGIISSIIPAPGVDIKNLQGFQLDVTATHGSSGGPVFKLETGKLIGLISEGLPDAPGIVKAVQVYDVLENLPEIRNLPPNTLPKISE